MLCVYFFQNLFVIFGSAEPGPHILHFQVSFIFVKSAVIIFNGEVLHSGQFEIVFIQKRETWENF